MPRGRLKELPLQPGIELNEEKREAHGQKVGGVWDQGALWDL